MEFGSGMGYTIFIVILHFGTS